MIYRNLTPALQAALADTPIVLLTGARQTGKSTLVQDIASTTHPARYLTFDDSGALSAVRTDPAGFLAGMDGAVILDEVQRAPELFLALKAAVDRDRRPGRFLLTGSANVLLLPRLAETLVGRMEILTLWPLSQGEIEGRFEGFIDAVFADALPPLKPSSETWTTLLDRLLIGGYPEVLTRATEERRTAWFNSYVTTLLQRDVRDLAQIEGLTSLPRLLTLLATRATALLNFSELSRSIAMPQSTLKRYLALLETTFLLCPLPAWSSNVGKRLVKAPKMGLSDTGLLSALSAIRKERLLAEHGLAGPLLENFVVMELRKQTSWSRTRPQVFHFRTQTGQEVDVVLEDGAGRIVGIEVKASATISTHDFKGLRALAETAGSRFYRGVVLYTGTEPLPFGPQFYALPVSALWELGSDVKQ
ncbi:MAG: ATP-binding protein [Deltaproteobacteria bacterium]|nr:ATP-binding protein [Deltaproteobacteria bacterium]